MNKKRRKYKLMFDLVLSIIYVLLFVSIFAIGIISNLDDTVEKKFELVMFINIIFFCICFYVYFKIEDYVYNEKLSPIVFLSEQYKINIEEKIIKKLFDKKMFNECNLCDKKVLKCNISNKEYLLRKYRLKSSMKKFYVVVLECDKISKDIYDQLSNIIDNWCNDQFFFRKSYLLVINTKTKNEFTKKILVNFGKTFNYVKHSNLAYYVHPIVYPVIFDFDCNKVFLGELSYKMYINKNAIDSMVLVKFIKDFLGSLERENMVKKID